MRKPNCLFKTIFELNDKMLRELKKKVVFLDADNTLFLPNVPLAAQDLQATRKLLLHLTEQVIIVIISNNFSQDKATFFSNLGIETIFFAKKPLPLSFKKAHQIANKQLQKEVRKDEIIHIGDQFLTDGIGGAIYGIDYILVDPIDPKKDLIYAKPSRFLERIFHIRK